MIRFLSHAKPNELRGTVLLRLDFNTEDNWRMLAVLPTIRLLLKTSEKIVIASHRGRPNGIDKKFSLKKNADALSKLLKRKVVFLPGDDFKKIKSLIERSKKGSVFLLENLRFNPGEEKNDPKFAKLLASLADFYVNDAFAVSHRANASVEAIARFLPSYAGLELETEIVSLSKIMRKPQKPLTLILGGAKAADKLGVIAFFTRKTNWFLLGGGPANTILSLRGVDVKKSIRDTDPKDIKKLNAFSRLKTVIAPSDFKWHGDLIWDLGPDSLRNFSAIIAKSKTILWSGPLGFIEKTAFAKGSILIAKAIAKNRKAFSVAGGGETVMFLKKYNLDKKFSFISTGGGAMMEYLAGEKLPGIEALKR